MDERKFINNKEENRYELHVGDHIAFADYLTKKDGTVYMTHTESPAELAGQGIASELILKSLQDIKDQGNKVFPLCPFVVSYIKKNPEWKSIVYRPK